MSQFLNLFSGNDQLISGNHQRFDIMLYGKLRFVIILIGTEAVFIVLNVQRMPLHSYCGIVARSMENIFPGKINIILMYWRTVA
jgi:hypothetical protein